ncbi:hypothetical protein EIP91_011094 [Steccherinum ochraceum]|uniref:Golgi apparatus membrane protein TVP38 n=1 Tax=Steccherinum ochraceum TaxID=92696 RepID=A0A4R0RUS6_9APHY|nr:hypothetical protein EIP91_011094 [Steccherinum ochraceum]
MDEKSDPAFPSSTSRCAPPKGIPPQSPPSTGYPQPTPSSTPSCSRSYHVATSQYPYPSRPAYPSIASRAASSSAYSRPRTLRIANLLKPWIPVIAYAVTTFGFLTAIGFWRAEVFQGLDSLSQWLKGDEYQGYAVIFLLIFLTTIPPLPLYSTLIILSGYTFGPWTGAIISYFASLAGALLVFMASRAFFRESISRWLNCTITVKRVVKAIEKRPKLLFLIRLAPYPFNVMNCLLAASSTLTLRTYTICTALSLFKLIIHTSIGSSIRSFAEYHVSKPGQPPHDSSEENLLGHYSTVIGVTLCVGIFIYLSYVARRAVDDELQDDALDREETMAFLSDDDALDADEMAQTPLGHSASLPPRPSIGSEDRFVNGGYEEATLGLGH